MNKIWVVTLFPDYLKPLIELGVISQLLNGSRGEQIELHLVQLAEHSPKNFKGCDSAPFGGGPGMVMKADVLESALLKGVVEAGGYGENFKDKLKVIFTSPRGEQFDSQIAKNLSHCDKDLVFICGRYEGIDERFINQYVDQIISIGDYVLTGGEIAVMAIIDSCLRFKAGTLGNDQSASSDSFEDGLLEHPQYTRPRDFNGEVVPGVLTSGDHKKVANYNYDQKLKLTKKARPDLYERYINESKK